MHEIDRQHTEFTDTEDIRITDLDTPGSSQSKRVAQMINLTGRSRVRSGLCGLLVLILLGIFLRWPISTTPGAASDPTSHILTVTNTQKLVFTQDSNHVLTAYQATIGRVLWHFNLPTVATWEVLDQNLYSYFVTAPGTTELVALNVNTGNLIWHDTLPASFTNGREQAAHSQTPPPFFSGDNALYIRSSSGVIYALNASTGQTMWTHQAGRPPALHTNILVQNGVLAFLASNSTLHVLNARTGQDIIDSSAHYSSLPMIDGEVLYAFSATNPFSIQAFHIPDGRQLWTYPLPDDHSVLSAMDGVLLLSHTLTSRTTLLALRDSDGQQLWTYQTSDGQPVLSTSFAVNGIGYLLQHDATLVGLRISDGSIRWRTHIPDLQRFSAQANQFTLLSLNPETMLLFSFFKPNLTSQPRPIYALRTDDGRIIWHNAQPLASLWTLAGTLYTTQNGQLDAWRESDGQYLWSYSTSGDAWIVGDSSANSQLLFLLDSKGTLYTLRTSDGKLLWSYP